MDERAHTLPLKVTTLEGHGNTVTLHFDGPFDEDLELSEVKIEPGKKIIMDMAKLALINSCGCRNWVKWIRTIGSSTPVEFVNCPKEFIENANMIDGFVPKNGSINSFSVPYYCEACDNLTTKIFKSDQVKTAINKIPEKIVCEKCKKEAEIDVIPASFFRFLGKDPTK